METPRLRSAFPETPAPKGTRNANKTVRENNPTTTFLTPNKSLASSSAKTIEQAPHGGSEPLIAPLIPYTIIDAPSQRLYVLAAFGLLQVYKVSDLSRLYSEDDSISELWFILKWLVLDGLFLKWLPTLRIPWLTFNSHIVVGQIVLMAVLNIVLGLKYQMLIIVFISTMWKQIYNREISISERSVRVSDIVANRSYISGKHTVHFLPEGSAKLNPKKGPFCLDQHGNDVTIPIRINATTPQLIQLTRTIFETGDMETINITQKEIKRMIKQSPRHSDPKIYDLPYRTKIPGLYRLTRVLDVSNLVVRIFRSEALVVECPQAFIGFQNAPNDVSSGEKCKGDLSNFSISVRGLPPLKVKYSRVINTDEKEVIIQSISPENYESPLTRSQPKERDFYSRGKGDSVSWALPHQISIPLNESLSTSGLWTYSIDEVQDASGNFVNFTRAIRERDNTHAQSHKLLHSFNVHERPMIRFDKCDAQNPSMVARGTQGALPIALAKNSEGPPYSVSYLFTPQEKLNAAVEHAKDAETKEVTMKSRDQAIVVTEPGLYTLTGIASRFCSGEVFESSSCLFLTPPDPSLAIATDEILDKCAGSSIGLTIDLTLVGTPPFTVSYKVIKDKRHTDVVKVKVTGTRHQLRLTPSAAGLYSYEFFALDDKVYKDVQLDSKQLRAEQRVIPLAGAKFAIDSPRRKSCIEEPVEFDVKMQGSGPWKLNYELIHAGKRTRFTDNNITSSMHTIRTPNLSNGGEYTLALVTVEDSHGCKVFLQNEAKIDVRRQRPRGSFASIDGNFRAEALEGDVVKIPLRLSGEKPFSVQIARQGSSTPVIRDLILNDYNSYIEVKDEGRYEIIDIRDAICPGSATENAKFFDVEWISKPHMEFADSSAIQVRGSQYVRNDVCEGDEDATGLNFIGNSPFIAMLERTFTPEKSDHRSIHRMEIKTGVNTASLRMDTSKPGIYRYRFLTLSDANYDKQAPLKEPLFLEQMVHPRPTAKFKNTGKIYKYCLEAGAGDDVIPIVLTGVAPFALTIRIKHFSTSKVDTVVIPVVDSNSFNFRIPSHALTLGGHSVSVAKVKDARGCTWKANSGDEQHVKVVVADNPTITALDNKPYYCVGDRLTYSLAGVPPFMLEYKFEGRLEKVKSSATFQRIAERPGKFEIISLTDSASDCKVNAAQSKRIYPIPSVRVSGGDAVVEGIHEGEQTEISFHLSGSPPFTFTYIRSQLSSKKGAKPKVLEMHTQTTESDYFSILASQEGTYEVISIQDKYCAYSSQKAIEQSAKQLPYS